MKEVSPDLIRSHGFLNYLNAGYQGNFAALNILSRLKSPTFNEQKLAQTKEALSKAQRWLKALKNSVALFSVNWQKVETFEAEECLQLLFNLRSDLINNSKDLIVVFQSRSEAPEAIHTLISSLGKYAYSRDNYIKGFIDFGKATEYDALINQYSTLVPSAEADVKLVHDFLKILQDNKTDAPFFANLKYQCFKLPGIFRSQAHDLLQLLVLYTGGLTYEVLGMDETRANQWKSVGAEPSVAGYWEAHGIGPDEALAWLNAGAEDHDTAATWKLHGFEPATAQDWLQQKFGAGLARVWAQAGIEATKAAEYCKQGILDPNDIPPK